MLGEQLAEFAQDSMNPANLLQQSFWPAARASDLRRQGIHSWLQQNPGIAAGA
jgi:hypothetical protein